MWLCVLFDQVGFGGQNTSILENQYSHVSKRYRKKGHDEKIFKKVGTKKMHLARKYKNLNHDLIIADQSQKL